MTQINMSNTLTSDPILSLVQQLVRALAEKKAGDLKVLKVAAKSTITDYLVLATGTSDPHLRALRIEVERVLDAAKHPIAGMEVGGYGSGWTVVDAYQIMAHIFTPEQRGNYALERLWKDAESLNLTKFLEVPKAEKLVSKAVAAVKTKASPKAKPAPKPKAKPAAKPKTKSKSAAKPSAKPVANVSVKEALEATMKAIAGIGVKKAVKSVAAKKTVKTAAVKTVTAKKKAPAAAKKAAVVKKKPAVAKKKTK